MTSDIKQNLNRHEMILERYKTLLFSDKNKSSNPNTNNIRDPINEITSKTLKIKENIDLGLETKNFHDANSLNVNLNLNKTEKKIEDILSKANYAVFEKPNKHQIPNEHKTLSSSEQVKKIVEENYRNKVSEAKNTDKVSELIKKYETIDQNNKANPESADHKGYLESLKLDQQSKNMNLNTIIEKNNNLIENLKKKYLNNISQNNVNTISKPCSNANAYSETKIPTVQKNYKEYEGDFHSSSGNPVILENLNFKAFNTINASGPFGKKFNDEADLDNQDTINKINLLRQKYLKDERPKSSIEIKNKLFKEEAYSSQEKSKEEISLSKDPEINSIINKYKSKLGSSNSLDYSKDQNKQEESSKPENPSFNSRFDEVNKKIEGINFTFQKGKNGLFHDDNALIKEKGNVNNIYNKDNKGENANDEFINQIINKKIEREKKELMDKEKNENTDNYSNEYLEPLNIDNFKSKNATEESKDKKGFITKINFIEEKLNRIENLINFEEKESNKNKTSENLEEKSKRKSSSENENASGYLENFTLGNCNIKNDFRSVKKSVFSELNKNEDITTDDEKQSNHILSFAQNIRKLKELKEKNSQMIEEMGDKKSAKRKDKAVPIPIAKKNKNCKSDFSDNYTTDKNESDNNEEVYHHKIIVNKGTENAEESELNANKIIHNLIETEKIFESNSKDFIDEEIERERKSANSYLKKSNTGNPNSSVINNMTLSYSISSNEKSDGNLLYNFFKIQKRRAQRKIIMLKRA